MTISRRKKNIFKEIFEKFESIKPVAVQGQTSIQVETPLFKPAVADFFESSIGLIYRFVLYQEEHAKHSQRSSSRTG